VNVFEELNFDDDEKAVFKESNFALGAVIFEYKLTKLVLDVCRLLMNDSSPRARSDPAEVNDSRLKVVEDWLGRNNKLAGVKILSVFLPW
jgi:hypothetical protein